MKRIALSSFVALVAIACDQQQRMTAPDAAAVTATVAIQSLSITGAPPVAGATSQLTATARFSDGTTRDVTSLAGWSSSDPAVLMISSSGMATGRTGGHALAQASYGGLTAVLDLNVVVALPPPPSVPPPGTPVEIFNCEKQGPDDASNIRRTLYIDSYPRTTISQVDLGFTSKDGQGSFSVRLRVLANDKDKVGEKTVRVEIARGRRTDASFVFTPALNIPQRASVRLVATQEDGPGELSWEGNTDSRCPVIVTDDSSPTTQIVGPKIPVRILGS
jgi:hypothetical protein